MSPYDVVLYPAAVFPQTHPNRLATVAFLRGVEAAPINRCRVLELGCGVASNLIGMAFQLPGLRSNLLARCVHDRRTPIMPS